MKSKIPFEKIFMILWDISVGIYDIITSVFHSEQSTRLPKNQCLSDSEIDQMKKDLTEDLSVTLDEKRNMKSLNSNELKND